MVKRCLSLIEEIEQGIILQYYEIYKYVCHLTTGFKKKSYLFRVLSIHIRSIAKIRKFIDEENAKIVVRAFVTAKLDSCNSLLYGLPQHLISRLQSIQNTATRVVTRTRKFDHLTPVLKQLHWLPVRYRIVFKILQLVYKAPDGTASSYISERELRSSSQHLLAES